MERYTFTAQLAVLRTAPTVMTRLMKKEASYLLIAKVLVISRLLHKALSQGKSKPPIVDQLWERLLSVRRKLLRRIDNQLASSTGETANLVQSTSAYALATSSTPTDVLQHFLKVRMDKIGRELKQDDDELAKHGISSLKLCIQTCLDTQAIFPRKLAEALVKLKAQPLVQDPEVRDLFELNLDVHDRWLGDEVKSYTPWPRHDELQRPDAERILHRWSKEAIAAFLKGVKKALEREDRLKEVAHLRQELIETWILSGSRMAGVKSANVLDDMRDAMNEKLDDIVHSRTQRLQAIVTKLERQLSATSTTDTSSSSLWSTTSKASDLSNGAQSFKSTILNTFQGRDEPVNNVMTSFDNWMESVLEVKSIVKSMKEARWDDTFADDVDEGSDDDLEDSKQTLLSDDDPRLLEETTQSALGNAMQNLGKSLSSIVETSAKSQDELAVCQIAFLLRVIREVGDRLPRLKLQDKSSTLPSPLSSETLSSLHAVLARYITQQTIDGYEKSLKHAGKRSHSTQILWEGHPPLPSQPSSSAFRLLRELNTNMASLGSDLWAPISVAVLKTQIAKEVANILQKHAADISASSTPTQTNGNDTESNTESTEPEHIESQPSENNDTTPSRRHGDIEQQNLTQLMFDALYIQRFSSTDKGIEKAVRTHADHLDDTAVARLGKSAGEYARKTYLLFALLS